MTRRTTGVVLAAAVLLAAAAAPARSRGRPAASQPTRAAAPVKVYRPPPIDVRGKREVPLKLLFGRQAPAAELRPFERGFTARIVDAVRRAPF